MATTNTRLFKDVQDLTINSLNVGGVDTIEVAQSYVDLIQHQDGAEGPRGLGKAGERVDIRFSGADIASDQSGTELIDAILGSTPATAIFYGQESGNTTYGKTTLGTANSKMVFHALTLRANRTDYSRLEALATMRMDQAEGLDDVCLYVDGEGAPTRNTPVRLWRPTTLTHAANPIHIVDFTMSIVGRLLIDYGDTDEGLAAVDVADWTISGTVTHRDSMHEGVETVDISTKLLKGAQNDMAVTLEGVAGGADKTITILQTEFTGRRRLSGSGYTDHVMDWRAQFDVAGTEKTLAQMVTVA